MSQINLDKLPKDVNESGNKAAENSTGKSVGKWIKIIVSIICAVYMFIPELTDVLPVIGWLDELVAGAVSVISLVSALKTGRYDPNTRMEQRSKDIFGDDNY